MNFNEHNTLGYDWDDRGVYVIELSDYVEGGEDGVSNRQAKELTARTRNLHTRMTTAEGEIDTLQEQTPIRVEAALASAKTYADGKDTVLRNDMAIADTSTLNTAKAYAEQVVAALVDGSPAALNTLQELAAALGGDPNFATTVMQAIGERMKTADVNAALAGKAGTSHAHTAQQVGALPITGGTIDGDIHLNYYDLLGGRWMKQVIAGYDTVGLHFNRSIAAGTWSQLDIYTRGSNGFAKRLEVGEGTLRFQGNDVYHAGNLAPATPTAPGLMSKEDKSKLNTLQPSPLAAYKIAANGYIQMSSGPKASSSTVGKNGSGHYIIYHNVGNTNYYTIPTTYGNRDFVGYVFIIGEYADRVEIGTSNMNGGFNDANFQVVLMSKS